MYPKLFSFRTPSFLQGILPDQITLYSYGLMIAIGIMVSYWFVNRRTKKFGISKDELSIMFIWSIFAGFVGGKLFFFFEDFSKYLENPSLFLNITGGGFVFYGSVLFRYTGNHFLVEEERYSHSTFFRHCGLCWTNHSSLWPSGLLSVWMLPR